MVRYNHRTENNWKTQPMFQEKVESLELSNSIAQDHLKKERLTSWMKNIKKWVVDRDFCIVLLLKLGSFSTASDKIYIWRLEVTTSQDCVSFIFCSPPPLCSNSLFRHKRLLVQQSSRVKKVCSTAYVFKCNACTFYYYCLPKNTKGQLHICETPAALPKGRMWSLENRMGWAW